MPYTTIATCCYCGTRVALVLRGDDRHELSCSQCGAPLHDLKMLRKDHEGRPSVVRSARVRTGDRKSSNGRHVKPRPRQRRKSTARWFLEEAWDVIEDIFD